MMEQAVDEHLTLLKKKRRHDELLHNIVTAFPTLQALNYDPEVRDHLNTYRDTHPLLPVLAGKQTHVFYLII